MVISKLPARMSIVWETRVITCYDARQAVHFILTENSAGPKLQLDPSAAQQNRVNALDGLPVNAHWSSRTVICVSACLASLA